MSPARLPALPFLRAAQPPSLARFVSGGTADDPLECSQDCLDSCAWTFPPTLSAPCLEKCTVSPLLGLVLVGFATRVLDYAVDAAWMAVTGTGSEQEEHAGALRRCLCPCLRR